MEKILANPRYRRMLLLVVGLLAAVSLLIRFLILPSFDPKLRLAVPAIAAVILDNLFSSVLVTVFIGAFVYWLDPEILRSAKMDSVAAADIARLLEDAMRTTEVWWFRGATGRYLRAVTLPRIADVARRSSSTKEINIQILNPDSESICRQYALYRRSLGSAVNERSNWTYERVRAELYATLLKICIVRVQEPMLRFTVSLANSFSSFRLDLSSAYVVVTKEDPKAPGLRCDHGTYFYKAYHDDMVLSARQCTQVALPPQSFDPDSLTTQNVRTLLVSLGFGVQALSNEDLDDIINRAKDSRSPYV
jgi:hypothetical protein